jgi:hypothetical protein
MCSYNACRKTGIKFRYCAYCNVPVAKRNFRRRHQHGGEPDGESQSGDDTASRSSAEEEKSKTPSKTVKQVKSVEKPLDMSTSMISDKNKSGADSTAIKQESQISSPSNPEEQKNVEADESDEAGCRRSSFTSSSDESHNRMTNNRMTMSDRDSDSLQSPTALRTVAALPSAQQPPIALRTNNDDRTTRWAALLTKRPPSDDSNAMQAWLVEVLSVSDIAMPLKDEDKKGGENYKADPIGQETSNAKSKASLLTKKRPHLMATVEEVNVSRAKDGGFAEWKERKKCKGLPTKGYELAQKE